MPTGNLVELPASKGKKRQSRTPETPLGKVSFEHQGSVGSSLGCDALLAEAVRGWNESCVGWK